MIKITRFFYINILCVPLFVLAYFSKSLTTLCVAYCVATVHELFHLFAALFLSVRVKSVIIMPFGITLRLSDSVIKSPTKEVIVAFAGPFSNILMICVAVLLKSMYIWSGPSLFLFTYLNAIMFLLNSLPCMPLDGGRVLRAMLVGKVGYINAVNYQRKLEKLIILVLLILGVVLIFITKFNISLVMVAAFLIFNVSGEETRKNYIVMREIMGYKDKLKNRKYMRTKGIAAKSSAKALDIMKCIGYDSFYLINVIDDKIHIKKTLTEGELIDAINKKSVSVTLDEII